MIPAERLRRLALLEQRDRAIVMDAGTTHPGFGGAFLRYYLTNYITDKSTGMWIPGAAWHAEFAATVFGSLGTEEQHVHVAPRGYAKTTIGSLSMVLAVLAKQLKHYVWILQDTHDAAKQSMGTVLAETRSNERLLRDFPHLRPAMDEYNRPVAYRDDDVVFMSGQRLQAISARQNVRGRREKEHRPDLLLADDFENDEMVNTKFQRDKTDDWFSGACLGALATVGGHEVHVLGTILHHDSLLVRLKKRDGWLSHTYLAVTDPSDFTTSTWPELWTAEKLEKKRKSMTARTFAREFLHQVVPEDEQRFRRDMFKYADWPGGTGGITRIGVDPAIKEQEIHDFSSITVVSKVRGTRDVYVRDEWHGRVRGRALVDKVEGYYLRYGGIVVFETVQAQAWGAQALQDRGIPVRETNTRKDKLTLAEPVALYYENGQVWHATHLRDTDWELQHEQFPSGEHDDCVDSNVMAIRDVMLGDTGGGVSGVHLHQAPARQEEYRDPRGTEQEPSDAQDGAVVVPVAREWLVETPSPYRTDEALTRLPGGACLASDDEGYVTVDGYYVLGVAGNPEFLLGPLEQGGHARIIRELGTTTSEADETNVTG